MRKGQIACFLPYMILIFHFKCTLKCRLQFSFNLDQSTILLSGNGLRRLSRTGANSIDAIMIKFLALCTQSLINTVPISILIKTLQFQSRFRQNI